MKHRIHRKQSKESSFDNFSNSSSTDFPKKSSREIQEQSGTGPGMLEDEIISMYIQEKNQPANPPKHTSIQGSFLDSWSFHS